MDASTLTATADATDPSYGDLPVPSPRRSGPEGRYVLQFDRWWAVQRVGG